MFFHITKAISQVFRVISDIIYFTYLVKLIGKENVHLIGIINDILASEILLTHAHTSIYLHVNLCTNTQQSFSSWRVLKMTYISVILNLCDAPP